jgi:hypothetical protein
VTNSVDPQPATTAAAARRRARGRLRTGGACGQHAAGLPGGLARFFPMVRHDRADRNGCRPIVIAGLRLPRRSTMRTRRITRVATRNGDVRSRVVGLRHLNLPAFIVAPMAAA